MCSNELPTIRLIGSKTTTTVNGFTEPVCPVLEVQDGAGAARFAVFDDGFVVQKGHNDTDTDALNSGHFSSIVAGDNSVYIGSCRMSYNRPARALHFETLKGAYPSSCSSAASGSLPARRQPR